MERDLGNAFAYNSTSPGLPWPTTESKLSGTRSMTLEADAPATRAAVKREERNNMTVVIKRHFGTDVVISTWIGHRRSPSELAGPDLKTQVLIDTHGDIGCGSRVKWLLDTTTLSLTRMYLA